MKRDWDVVRQILLTLETLEGPRGLQQLPEIDSSVFVYHITILADGGLVHGRAGKLLDGTAHASANRLTWAGHELLDKMRDEKLWGKIKKAAEEKSLSMSFDIVGIIFKQLAKNKLGIDLD